MEIDGSPTVLETTITEVTDEGFSTVSMAEAEGYRDGKYTEERTYTKGIGLTSFSNTPMAPIRTICLFSATAIRWKTISP